MVLLGTGRGEEESARWRPWDSHPPVQPGRPCPALGLTTFSVSGRAGALLQGPLLLVPAAMAAVVVVVWPLAGAGPVQGIAEMAPVGALGQGGDGAFHGAGIRHRLWAQG